MLRAAARFARRADLVLRLTETWFRRPTTPRRLVLDVTRRCNLRCQICRTWEVAPSTELSPPEIARILRQMPGLVWLDVTGGEPFLRSDAADVFDAVIDAAPKLRVLHFQSNGWFERRVVETSCNIIERRPDLDLIVTISIDGPPRDHDRMRGMDGSFERALRTYSILRELPGLRAYIGTTVTPFNDDCIEELGQVLAMRLPDFRRTEWHWNRMQISAHFFRNADLGSRIAPAPPQLLKQHLARRGFPRSLVDLMELLFLVNLEYYQRGEPSGIVCQATRSAAFVSPEGRLFPCHVWDRPLGDLRQQTVRDVWSSRAARQARADAEALACGGCFTPCEAYPALAGAPLQTARATLRRSLRIVQEAFGS